MATRTASIKAHTRTSKNGKTHKVKAHGRQVSFKDMVKEWFQNGSLKKAATAGSGSMAFAGILYVLSTAMSVVAALIWAILLGCMAVIAMLLMTKGQRRAKRRKIRQAAALSVERRLKLWTHHKVSSFKKPSDFMKKKAAPKPASRPRKTATNDRPKTGATHAEEYKKSTKAKGLHQTIFDHQGPGPLKP
jgi:hypothetical protein